MATPEIGRERLLSAAHVLPLMDLVRALRAQGYQVPNVDPYDGGIYAQALFLLESPGPQAVGTQFISRDNPDPSAKNMSRSLDQAGFKRSQTFLWNVVPYCVSTLEQKRNATPAQVRCAAADTQLFIDCLRELKVVIFCGRRAQGAQQCLRLPTGVHGLQTFHPGQWLSTMPVVAKISRRRFGGLIKLFQTEILPSFLQVLPTPDKAP